MDLLLHECNGDQHYSTIKNFSMVMPYTAAKSACTLIQLKNYLQYMQ